METIRRFEDLIAWQKARALAREIYQTRRQGAFARDFGLAGQIQRAVVSIMSNVAEGFERSRRGEFHQFLSMAKASCAEVRSQLYVALDVGYLDRMKFNELLARAEEGVKCLAAFGRPLKGKNSVMIPSLDSAPSTHRSALSVACCELKRNMV